MSTISANPLERYEVKISCTSQLLVYSVNSCGIVYYASRMYSFRHGALCWESPDKITSLDFYVTTVSIL